MALLAKDKGGTDFEPLAAGLHHAVCYGIIDLGTQPTNNPQFKAARKVVFLWEVQSERIEFEREGTKKNLPRGISGIYTLSLSPKSKLRPALESWRGRPFAPAELEGFDLKSVLGANCFLNVVHNHGQGQNAGKVYANVASINPLPRGSTKQNAENPLVWFSLDECADKILVPATVPDWIKGKILQSEECVREARRGGAPEPTEDDMANVSHAAKAGDDEDVPF